MPGLYVAGWLRRGPTGIIGSNIGDARDAAQAILDDAPSLLVQAGEGMDDMGAKGLRDLLEMQAAGRQGAKVVDWKGHGLIDRAEVKAGASRGKPREKVTSVGEMLRLAEI